MNQKYKTMICVILFVPIYFLLYAFLHEAGHALVILAYGGTIENFVFWNFGAHVSSSGGEFTTFGTAMKDIGGMLFPTILGAAAIGFYKPCVKFAGYHLCYLATFIGLLCTMLVWVIIPVTSLFTLPPQGEDVTKFLNVTRFHPLLVASGVLFLAGSFLLLVHAKGILSKATFKNIICTFNDNNKSADKIAEKQPNRKFIIASLLLIIMAIVVFIIANNVKHIPSTAIFNTKDIILNVLEEKSREYKLVIEESRVYFMNIKVEARGFVTALRIVNEDGKTYLQTDGEGFSRSIMDIKLEKGVYTLSLLFLTNYEAVSDFFESTGFGELNPKDIDWINAAFNRDNISYSVEYDISIR